MANALLFGFSGSGKTVNSTRVEAPNRGKNLLLCSDNSHVVLKHFDRKNLDIIPVSHWIGKTKKGVERENYINLFEKAVESKKYDNIITDNLSDLFDLAILEYREEKFHNDIRQSYMEVYNKIKQLTRFSGQLDCNCIFTTWADTVDGVDEIGNPYRLIRPLLPNKIINNVCGLMNIVGYVTNYTNDNNDKVWGYVFENTDTLKFDIIKDQLGCRTGCMPEKIFNI